MTTPNQAARSPGTMEALAGAGEVGWLPAVCRNLDGQLALAARLTALGDERGAALSAGDHDRVADLLAAREPVIDDLSALGAVLEPLIARMGDLWSALDGEQRRSLSSRIDRLRETLDRVTQRDAADAAALEARRQALADELAGIDRGRTALGAYARGEDENGGGLTVDGPRFQDRRG